MPIMAVSTERVHLISRQRITKEDHAVALYEAVAAGDIESARESIPRHISKDVGRLGLTKD
jgi:DNA-binding GntR family transcriptional regulator